jgi:hypothetical protein
VFVLSALRSGDRVFVFALVLFVRDATAPPTVTFGADWQETFKASRLIQAGNEHPKPTSVSDKAPIVEDSIATHQ